MDEKKEEAPKPRPKPKPRTLHVHSLRGKCGFEVRLEDDSTVLLKAYRPKSGWFKSMPFCFYGKSETEKPEIAPILQEEVPKHEPTKELSSRRQNTKKRKNEQVDEEKDMVEIGTYSTRSFSSIDDLQVQGQQWTLQNIAWFVSDYRLKCVERGIEWSWTYKATFSSDRELRDEKGTKLAQFVHDRGWFSKKEGVLEIWMDRVDSRDLNDAIILSAISFLEMAAERARRDQTPPPPPPLP
jgi:hypothetical protein